MGIDVYNAQSEAHKLTDRKYSDMGPDSRALGRKHKKKGIGNALSAVMTYFKIMRLVFKLSSSSEAEIAPKTKQPLLLSSRKQLT